MTSDARRTPSQITVDDARTIARNWVDTAMTGSPGLAGAVLHGPILERSASDILLPTSDVDLLLVGASQDDLGAPLGKQMVAGVVLEPSFLSLEQAGAARSILADRVFARSFASDGVIADATGRLRATQDFVRPRYRQRRWIGARMQSTHAECERWLAGIEGAPTWYDQVTCCWFALGLACHVLLVAGLRNPTVRKRYSEQRSLLHEHGLADLHERVLEVVGVADLPVARVQTFLDELESALAIVGPRVEPTFRFAADLKPSSHLVAIAGSQALLDNGEHREAMFWILATYSRCMLGVAQPERWRVQLAPGYERLLGALDLASLAALQQRRRKLQAFLPELLRAAERIADAVAVD